MSLSQILAMLLIANTLFDTWRALHVSPMRSRARRLSLRRRVTFRLDRGLGRASLGFGGLLAGTGGGCKHVRRSTPSGAQARPRRLGAGPGSSWVQPTRWAVRKGVIQCRASDLVASLAG
jgi:hypothetical protein